MPEFISYRDAAKAKIRFLGDSGGGVKLKAVLGACDRLRNKSGALDLENKALAVMLLLEALDCTEGAQAAAHQTPDYIFYLLGEYR